MKQLGTFATEMQTALNGSQRCAARLSRHLALLIFLGLFGLSAGARTASAFGITHRWQRQDGGRIRAVLRRNSINNYELSSNSRHRGNLLSPSTTAIAVTTNKVNGDDIQDFQLQQQQWAVAAGVVPGPSPETKPDYEKIIGPLGKAVDSLFLTLFRQELAKQVLGNRTATVASNSIYMQNNFDAIIALASLMNRQTSDRTIIHASAQQVLRNLFPSWMPGSYAVLFSKPFPGFSARMNAWATKVAGTWLMGECELNDVELKEQVVVTLADGTTETQTITRIAPNQGLLVERCRFLEESGCASVCVNSCKIPTQNFFAQDMGLPLTMEPNYDTFECQFSFGLAPTAETEFMAKQTPCLARCPTVGSLRKFHNNNNNNNSRTTATASAQTSTIQAQPKPCELMERGSF